MRGLFSGFLVYLQGRLEYELTAVGVVVVIASFLGRSIEFKDMKLKLDQTRTYDKDGLRRRAACLCLRSEDKSEILLVTSSRHTHLWIVPGGGLDPGETPDAAALREIEEEAGVQGKMIGLLDIFENVARKTRTYVYVVVVESLADDYDDAKKIGRARKWFSLEDACRQLQLHKPVQTSYVKTFMNRKSSGSRLVHNADSSFEQLPADYEANLISEADCDDNGNVCVPNVGRISSNDARVQ